MMAAWEAAAIEERVEAMRAAAAADAEAKVAMMRERADVFSTDCSMDPNVPRMTMDTLRKTIMASHHSLPST